MNSRSTGTHFGNDLVAAVESSHGVRLTGGSTGGIVEAFGDDANITLRVRGQGTGGVVLGNSSSPVTFGGSLTFGGASTTPIATVQRYLVQFTPPALAANAANQSTITVTGLTTSAYGLTFTPTSTLSPVYTWQVQCVTADELTIRFQNTSGSTIGTGQSTNRAYLLAYT